MKVLTRQDVIDRIKEEFSDGGTDWAYEGSACVYLTADHKSRCAIGCLADVGTILAADINFQTQDFLGYTDFLDAVGTKVEGLTYVELGQIQDFHDNLAQAGKDRKVLAEHIEPFCKYIASNPSTSRYPSWAHQYLTQKGLL